MGRYKYDEYWLKADSHITAHGEKTLNEVVGNF